VKKRRWQIQLLAALALGATSAGCAALPPAAWSSGNSAPGSLAFAAKAPTVPAAQLGSSAVVRGQAGGAPLGGFAPQTPSANLADTYQTPGSQNHTRYPMPANGVGATNPAAPRVAQGTAPGASPQYYNGAVFGAAPPAYAPPPGYVAPLPPPAYTPPVSPLPPPQSGGVVLAPGELPFVPPSAIPQDSVLAPRESYADIDVFADETRTGRFMFGVGVNSDAGVTAQITVDERNFNIARPPTSFEDILNGTAWRGAGQGFRFEAMPGNQLQRYLVSFTEPYLFNTPISFSSSGYYYNRRFFDWTETRAGGRLGLGYRITPDLSLATSVRAEDVEIEQPRVTGVEELERVLGHNDLFTGRVSITQDTRDSPFAATEGHYLELAYEQGFGDFDYPRGELDYRQYFLMRERPDGSGRHTLSYNFRLGFSGSQTPLFEHYFAGGYSTLRGFNFRGASPMDMGVTVGGNFQMLGSVEYMFPFTADDMLKGVVFTDFGTVEEDIEINADNYRVAPGFGLRIFVPAMGPAPIALDFAFPVAMAETDQERMFSFFIGFGR
jgi:outer membrane protein insertion porin family